MSLERKLWFVVAVLLSLLLFNGLGCTPVDDDGSSPYPNYDAYPSGDARPGDSDDTTVEPEVPLPHPDAAGDVEDTDALNNSPPELIEVSTNLQRLEPGDSLTVSAIVRDPDGQDDMLGGSLRDVASGATLARLLAWAGGATPSRSAGTRSTQSSIWNPDPKD